MKLKSLFQLRKTVPDPSWTLLGPSSTYIWSTGPIIPKSEVNETPSSNPAAPPTSEKNWVDSYSSCSIEYDLCSGFR